MGLHVRDEEYATLGDFMMVSFVRDQPELKLKFSVLDDAYLSGFQGKLAQIKELEGKLRFTEEQKSATKALYAEAGEVNNELNFLSMYMKDAGLPTSAVSALKKSLSNGNIEGALLELKDVVQYVKSQRSGLEAKGMDAGFPTALEDNFASMAAKNTLQNTVMNARKQVVKDNQGEYDALYAYIANVAEKGKLFYKGKVKEDEYTITKIIARMRAPKRKGDEEKK